MEMYDVQIEKGARKQDEGLSSYGWSKEESQSHWMSGVCEEE